jgi:hypothetical protein
MTKIKVYGGSANIQGNNCRTFVATTSKNKVAEISGEKLHYINSHWCITGNELEIEFAMKNINKLCIVKNQYTTKEKYKVIKYND